MHIYLGIFLLASAMLALEIILTRILSFTTWYHLAFLAISTAMLGMTVAATAIYLDPKKFSADRLEANLGRACLGFAIAVPAALILLCMIPVVLSSSIMTVFGIVGITVACTFPFYFAGLAITLVLTKSSLPIGFVYASDLVGAAMGCLLVLAGLEVLDAPSLVLLCGAIAAMAGAVFAWKTGGKRLRAMNIAAAVLLATATIINAQSSRFIRPLVVKGRVQLATHCDFDRWNSFSRVAVYPERLGPPQLWGPSVMTPTAPVYQRDMSIDGDAATNMRQFHTLADIEHLRYDVTNVAHALRPHGPACVIGVGGGRDIQSALLFGHSHVTGIDVNPIFVSLLENEFRDFTGIAGRKDVTLVVDDARSYLSRGDQKFSVLQMSLIDTWAATGAGAMTLSENALYTLEGWKVFIERLESDGVFTVSRWYDKDNLGETSRLVALAAMVLMQNGATHPADHLALVSQGPIATLILSKQPMDGADVELLRKFCEGMQFNLVAAPGRQPEHPLLRSLLSVNSPSELHQIARTSHFLIEPTTDEDPHFFNILRLGDALNFFGNQGIYNLHRTRKTGVLTGNLLATSVLLALIVSLALMSLLTVVAPLVLRRKTDQSNPASAAILWSGAIYFSLIGAGFMLIEIAMVQRLSIFLGHPVYGLGIVLCVIILSSGVGSFLSERLPFTRAPWVYFYPVLVSAMIIGARFVLTALMTNLATAPMSVKIACSIAAIFPVGILLGVCFPTGMRLVRRVDPLETPWYWALNGIFGVLSAAVAVFISIFVTISANFYLAAGCYLLAAFCIIWIVRRHAPPPRIVAAT